jgi:hypothetical protein
MTKAIAKHIEKRKLTDKELARGATALQRTSARAGVVEVDLEKTATGLKAESPHANTLMHQLHLSDTLGTASNYFVSSALGDLEWMTRERTSERGDSSNKLNAALALIDAIRPQNELEGTLAQQMAGIHALTCEMLGRAKTTDRTDHIQLYGNLAIKLARTYTAQIEALSKMRRGGEQVVRHIHVDNRGGQAVIAETVNNGGMGNGNNAEQSYGTDAVASIGSAMLGENATGNTVPIASDEREKAVSHSRRD